MHTFYRYLAILVVGLAICSRTPSPAEEAATPAKPEAASIEDVFKATDEYARELLAAPPEGLNKGDVAMAFGWIYLNAVLGEPAYDKAAEYYEIAREEGMIEAGTMLGALHLNADVFGLGDVDVDRALAYYEESAGAGSAEANLVLGNLHYNGDHGLIMDPSKGGQYLVTAALRGSEAAIERLAPRLGQAGFPADEAELVNEALAAETEERDRRFVEATNKVIDLLEARLEEKGLDVGELDFENLDPAVIAGMSPEERTAYWAKVDKTIEDTCKAIVDRETDPKIAGDSALIIGVLYHLGILHGYTPEKAKYFMEYALERKVPEAPVALGEYYINILADDDAKAGERDVQRGLGYLNTAADAGSVDALRLLGVLYADGAEGLEKDAEKSERYLLRAAKYGDPQALELLEPVFERARAWEAANPGQKSPLPTGPDAIVDPELAKATADRRKELEAVYEKINAEIELRTEEVLGAPAK